MITRRPAAALLILTFLVPLSLPATAPTTQPSTPKP
jgi:hypothetical protein